MINMNYSEWEYYRNNVMAVFSETASAIDNALAISNLYPKRICFFNRMMNAINIATKGSMDLR